MRYFLGFIIICSTLVFSAQEIKDCDDLKKNCEDLLKKKNPSSLLIAKQYHQCIEDSNSFYYSNSLHLLSRAYFDNYKKAHDSNLIYLDSSCFYGEFSLKSFEENGFKDSLSYFKTLIKTAYFIRTKADCMKQEDSKSARIRKYELAISLQKKIFDHSLSNKKWKQNSCKRIAFIYDRMSKIVDPKEAQKFKLLSYDYKKKELEQSEDQKKKNNWYKYFDLAYTFFNLHKDSSELKNEILKHYTDALGYAKKQFKKTPIDSLAESYNKVGIRYQGFKDIEAIEYFEKAINIYKKLGNKEGLISENKSIGISYYYEKQYSKSAAFYEKALNIFKEINENFQNSSDYEKLIRDLYHIYKKAGNKPKEEEYWNILHNLKSKNKSSLNFKINSIDASPNGNKIVIGCSNGTAYLWNPSSSEEKKKVKHGNLVNHVSVSGNYFATIGKYHLKIWNTHDLSLIKDHQIENNDIVFFEIGPEAKYLVCGYKDHSLDMWDLRNGNQLSDNEIITLETLRGYKLKGIFRIKINNGKYEWSNKDADFLAKSYFGFSIKKSKNSIQLLNDDEEIIPLPEPLSAADLVWKIDDAETYITATKNGKIKILKEKDNNLIVDDSLDLRRMPIAYLVTINLNDGNLRSENFSNKLKNDSVLNKQIKSFNSTDFIIHLNDPNSIKEKIQKKLKFLSQKLFYDDFVFYNINGSWDEYDVRQKSNLVNELAKHSNSMRAKRQLFFLDVEEDLFLHLAKSTDSYKNEYVNSNKERCFISHNLNSDTLLTDLYLQSKQSIFCFFEESHQKRTLFFKELYDLSKKDDSNRYEDFDIKTYYEHNLTDRSIDFNLDYELDIEESFKVKSKQTVCLVVGVNDYKGNKGLKNLNLAVSNAKIIGKTVENKVNYNRVFILENPTISDFKRQLNDLLNNYTYYEGSQFILYFAGHGKSQPGTNTPHLFFKDSKILYDGDKIVDFEDTYSLSELKARFSSSITQVLLILDACDMGMLEHENQHVEKVESKPLPLKNNLNQRSKEPARVIITSSSCGQKTLDGGFAETITQFFESSSNMSDNTLLLKYINKNNKRAISTPQHLCFGYHPNKGFDQFLFHLK